MELRSNRTLRVGENPVAFLELMHSALQGYHNQVEFEFSLYVSGGQGITLKRTVFRLRNDEHLLTIVKRTISELSANQELAFHSNIYINSIRYIIPLIDFTFSDIKIKENLIYDIHNYLNAPVYLFSSGRSFHGYALDIISMEEWYKFLGKLLLFNDPSGYLENIDSRWIGHSLENGFSALRLSYNSRYYIKSPSYINDFTDVLLKNRF